MVAKFSEEKEKEIIRLYLEEGMNQKEIGKLYNTYNTSIRRVLERNNVPKRDKAHDRRSVNKNPFEDLSSKEVQYWLGYLAADGNVNDLSQKNNRISLDTNLDPEHLEKYRSFLGINKKIYKFWNKSHELYEYSLAFSNRKVCEYLHEIGITARKSKTLKVNFNLTKSFVLGYFDGNGFISKKRLGVSTGSREFLTQLKEFFYSNYDRIPNVQEDSKSSCYTVYYSSIPFIANIMVDLYNSSPVYLERKYNKFRSLYSSLIG